MVNILIGIKHEKRILSAHRTPDGLKEYVRSAEERGVKVFIGAAEFSAAIPGTIASYSKKLSLKSM